MTTTTESNGNGKTPRRRRRSRSKATLVVLKQRQEVESALVVKTKKEHQAIEARLRGRGYREIAQEMGIEYEEAAALVQGALKRDVEVDLDKLDELRQLEIGRIDRLWEIYFPRALGNEEEEIAPNMAAANFCMKLIKRRAELLGLDREVKAPAPSLNFNFGADAIAQMTNAAQDPTTLEAMERVAALFAHGDGALEGEWEEAAEEPPLDDAT